MSKPISERTHKVRRENDVTRGARKATHPRREARRVAAAERQAARAKRTDAEQIARIVDAGFRGCPEWQRLTSGVAA